MFPLKNGLNIIYFLYTGSHTSFPIHCGLREGNFLTYTALNVTKLTYFWGKYNNMFHIQNHTKDFEYIMDYTWKWLDMYFKNCFMICFHHTKF